MNASGDLAVEDLPGSKDAIAKRKQFHHPTYAHLIHDAIATLRQRGGSSAIAIRKNIEEKMGPVLGPNYKKLVGTTLSKMTKTGKLVRSGNTFKLSPEFKQENLRRKRWHKHHGRRRRHRRHRRKKGRKTSAKSHRRKRRGRGGHKRRRKTPKRSRKSHGRRRRSRSRSATRHRRRISHRRSRVISATKSVEPGDSLTTDQSFTTHGPLLILEVLPQSIFRRLFVFMNSF